MTDSPRIRVAPRPQRARELRLFYLGTDVLWQFSRWHSHEGLNCFHDLQGNIIIERIAGNQLYLGRDRADLSVDGIHTYVAYRTYRCVFLWYALATWLP